MVSLRNKAISTLSFIFLLTAGLMLAGCPKQPQVGEADAGAVAAASQMPPGPPGTAAGAPAAGAAAGPERVQPKPGVGTGTGTAPGAPGGGAPATRGPEAGPQAAAPRVGAASPGAGSPAGAAGAAAGVPKGAGAGMESPLNDIFFDFDKSALKPEGKAALDENVKWLKATAKVTLVIEGHCDERGTAEYNLALGERRARATRDYLVAAGIDAKRLSMLSYGEERPFVVGHDESAWKWNRRAHFVVK